MAEQIRRIQADHRPPLERCPTGLSELDAALGGGFLRASVHEFLAPAEGAPARSLALLVAARMTTRERCVLYIDRAGNFYPPGAIHLGIPLERLLVIRAQRSTDALWVTEQALRCRAVAAAILTVRNLDTHVSRRLQLAAETGGGLGLIIRTDSHPAHTFAATRLHLEPLFGETETRRTLISVLKQRGRMPVEPFVLELPDATETPFANGHASPQLSVSASPRSGTARSLASTRTEPMKLCRHA